MSAEAWVALGTPEPLLEVQVVLRDIHIATTGEFGEILA